MILENKGEGFSTTFGGSSFEIPAGKFEVSDKLGKYLLKKVAFWGKNVTMIEGPKKDIVQEIVPETIEEAPEEAPVEEAPAEETGEEEKTE